MVVICANVGLSERRSLRQACIVSVYVRGTVVGRFGNCGLRFRDGAGFRARVPCRRGVERESPEWLPVREDRAWLA